MGGIADDGLVAQRNARLRGIPQLRQVILTIGDVVYNVNGKSGAEMIAELSSESLFPLHMAVRRPEKPDDSRPAHTVVSSREAVPLPILTPTPDVSQAWSSKPAVPALEASQVETMQAPFFAESAHPTRSAPQTAQPSLQAGGSFVVIEEYDPSKEHDKGYLSLSVDEHVRVFPNSLSPGNEGSPYPFYVYGQQGDGCKGWLP